MEAVSLQYRHAEPPGGPMPNMSSAEHYDAAENLLAEAQSYHEPDTRAEWCLELAKMHLALSQASIATQVLRQRASAGPASPGKTS
jgi:hypothetical protein